MQDEHLRLGSGQRSGQVSQKYVAVLDLCGVLE